MVHHVDVLPEELVMEHHMSEPEPCIETEHVDDDIHEEFFQAIGMGSVIAVIWHGWLTFPEKQSRERHHNEQRTDTVFDLFLHHVSTVVSFGNRIG